MAFPHFDFVWEFLFDMLEPDNLTSDYDSLAYLEVFFFFFVVIVMWTSEKPS